MGDFYIVCCPWKTQVIWPSWAPLTRWHLTSFQMWELNSCRPFRQEKKWPQPDLSLFTA